MRYHALDSIRGLTLISMIVYHAVWDLVYLFEKEWSWFDSRGAYLWQQSICYAFILLSGFCWSLGKRKLKRGLIVFASGVLLTSYTLVFMPNQRVVFGILTLLGSCMLLVIPIEKYLKKINPAIGFSTGVLLFILSRNINSGYIGFENINIAKIPDIYYRNYLTSYLGFTDKEFYSMDYFSLFPWLFLFLIGYYIYRMLETKDRLRLLVRGKIVGIELLGRYSLLVYLVHQPVIYLGLEFVY